MDRTDNTADVQVLVAQLWAARLQVEAAQPPTTHVEDFDLDHGYAVARLLDARFQASGYRHAGLKVGFTNKAIWPKFGLDEPIVAPMYEQTVTAPDGPITLDRFHAPRAEVEVVFGLGRDGLEAAATNADEPLPRSAIRWVALGLELVDCHYPDWHLTPAGSVADYGLHGGLVVGPRVPAESDGFAARLERLDELRVTLHRDDRVAAEGGGSDVLGHPLSVLDALPSLLGHLAFDLRERSELVVSTGTMTPLVNLEAGGVWSVRAERDALPGFEVSIEAPEAGVESPA